MTGPTSSDLVVEPLTPRWWPAFEELLDQGGPAARCWCMAPRIGAAYRGRPAKQNRADFQAAVTHGPPPGLLGFREGLAVGWCQLTSRAAAPALDRQWRIRHVDDVSVWALTCFYVRKGHRRQGVMSGLIAAAIEVARSAGAPALEAYPLDAARSPSATSMGYAGTFAAAGFVEIARRSPERPIMRLSFA